MNLKKLRLYENQEEHDVFSPKPWLSWLFFLLTLVTTTWVSAQLQGVNLMDEPWRFTVGLPYSLALLAILGFHELGHYYMAKHHGMEVTPPLFFPVPFALGTFGAFIQMRSPAKDRNMLFDIAVAGPLAGLAVTVPVLYFGLKDSQVLAYDVNVASPVLGEVVFGSSLLFSLIAKISLGEVHMQNMVRLSPLAFAGWLGLIVTALNLLPIGQLDGGHIVRAFFGRRLARVISTTVRWTLLFVAIFIWQNLILWALIVFCFVGKGVLLLNDEDVLTPWRRRLSYVALIILGSIIIPLPY